MAAKLADRVSTRVKIKMTNKKGQILIEFANLNDLKRILNELDPA
jgi:ParB family chromosome partitioning protein